MTNNAPDYNDNLYFEERKMGDLTKQRKKGKLPEGWYYVKKDGEIEMLEYSCDVFLSVDVPLDEDEVTEVLAPVPSYEKLQSMNEVVNQAIAVNIKLVEENKRLKHDVGNLGYKIKNQRHEIDNRLKEIEKLKDLLKDAQNVLKMVDTYYGDYDSTKGFLIVQRIDEVLK